MDLLLLTGPVSCKVTPEMHTQAMAVPLQTLLTFAIAVVLKLELLAVRVALSLHYSQWDFGHFKNPFCLCDTEV